MNAPLNKINPQPVIYTKTLLLMIALVSAWFCMFAFESAHAATDADKAAVAAIGSFVTDTFFVCEKSTYRPEDSQYLVSLKIVDDTLVLEGEGMTARVEGFSNLSIQDGLLTVKEAKGVCASFGAARPSELKCISQCQNANQSPFSIRFSNSSQ